MFDTEKYCDELGGQSSCSSELIIDREAGR